VDGPQRHNNTKGRRRKKISSQRGKIHVPGRALLESPAKNVRKTKQDKVHQATWKSGIVPRSEPVAKFGSEITKGVVAINRTTGRKRYTPNKN